MVASKTKSRLKRAAIVFTVGIVVWMACSFAVAYRYLGRAQAVCEEPLPTVAWGKFESLRLTTVDGEDLGAWFLPGDATKPIVLLLHGNGGCRTGCLPLAEQLAAEKYPVLMLSLRTHGDSSGSLNDFGFSARRDVLAARNWLAKHWPSRKVIVWGQSLGAAAAIFAAKDLGDSVAGYFGLLTAAKVALPTANDINCLQAIGNIPDAVPVLFLAGGADTRAHVDEARNLSERIKSHSTLVVIDGAEHLQLQSADPVGYRAAISTFLGQFAK